MGPYDDWKLQYPPEYDDPKPDPDDDWTKPDRLEDE